MRIRLLVIAGVYAIGLFMGGFMTSIYYQNQQPYCPTEDSCTPDYYNGQWHIKEDTP